MHSEVKNWLFAQSMATLLLSICQSIGLPALIFTLPSLDMKPGIHPRYGTAPSPAAKNSWGSHELDGISWKSILWEWGDGACYDSCETMVISSLFSWWRLCGKNWLWGYRIVIFVMFEKSDGQKKSCLGRKQNKLKYLILRCFAKSSNSTKSRYCPKSIMMSTLDKY